MTRVLEIVAPDEKLLWQLPSGATSKCSECGWFSGGNFGENQHWNKCSKKSNNSSTTVPFTAASLYEFCKDVDDRWWYSEETPQHILDFFNNAVVNGGFESKEAWWNGGFNFVWGNNDDNTWQEAYNDEKQFDLLFGAFQNLCHQHVSTLTVEPIKTERKTQKARGIEQLNNFAWKREVQVLPHLFISNEQVEQIANAAFPEKDAIALYKAAQPIAQKGKIFARCCPLTPRHGFTDSVFVNIGDDYKELMSYMGELCHKMLSDDPQAELILMQPCFAHFNIVTNEKSIVIGKGHDGATGGKDTFTFPVSKMFEFSNLEKARIGLAPESGVFCEFVGTRRRMKRGGAGAEAVGGIQVTRTYLTQLRGGPQIDVTGDYIPREVVLDRKYLIPHKNPDTGEEYRDTEWEKVINDIKQKEDWRRYFVYHPGGAISSHFGVHCYINEIPYITGSIRLNKRSVLKPNAVIRKADLNSFQKGFRKAPALLKLIKPADGVRILLAALHNYPALDPSDPKQAEFLGIACEFAIHLGLATCLGESRYAKREKMDYITTNGIKTTREFVYNRVELFDLNYVLRKAHHRCPWFRFPVWAQTSSVGGLKWLECSEAVFSLWNAVCELVQNGSNESLGFVISELNKVVNICHNNAKMLTKFTGNAPFDFAAAKPHDAAFKIAPIVFELLNADVSEQYICFEKFDLPEEKWNAEWHRKRQAEERRVALEKTKKQIVKEPLKMPVAPIVTLKGKEQCQTCGWYWKLSNPIGLWHHFGCPFEGKKMPVEKIKHEPGCKQCQFCGYYIDEEKPQKHYTGCPIEVSKVNAAFEAPVADQLDDKCDDESCSTCYPNS